MELERERIVARLAQYVNLPSGSYDLPGLAAFTVQVESDMRALGFAVTRHGAPGVGDTLECVYGDGEDTLLLLGHMDTVFPRAESQPFCDLGGDEVTGSGVMDMKGGLLIMQTALSDVLPQLPESARVVCVLNADEEIGSGTSSALITEWAKKSFACLVFEPMRESGALVRQRKGVISFRVRCTGIRGHAGSAYLRSASAIQQLCAVIGELYALRDDARQISVNVGVISGGTAENVVCDEATALAEVRFYNPAYGEEILGKLRAICEKPGVPGTATELTVNASHPPFMATEKSLRLLALAQEVAREQGIELPAEDTGGAGDVSFASLAGVAALDGLGLLGFGAHTTKERGELSSFAQNAKLSAALMRALIDNPDAVR